MTDLISRKDAVAVADARLNDVPESVDLEADRSLFAAGYLAAAGSIKAALERLTAPAPPALNGEHCWHARPEAATYCCDCEGLRDVAHASALDTGEQRTMTVKAIQERRATLYQGLTYRDNPLAAAAMKTDLDYLLSIQDSHEKEVDKELRRWQDAIRDKLIDLGAPDHLIDGAGCGSGDPLDFTLAEVGQGVGYFVDERDRSAAAVAKLVQALKHALVCSGTPDDCDDCREAQQLCN